VFIYQGIGLERINDISGDSHSSKIKLSFNTIAMRKLLLLSVKIRQNIIRFRSRLKDHIDLSKDIAEKKKPNSVTVAAIRQECDSHCDPTFENNS